MKTNNYKIVNVLLILLVIITGCGNKEAKIDEAIANRDFEKARKIALKTSDNTNWDSVNHRAVYLLKVNRAQLAYIIDTEKDWIFAEQLARELNAEDAFHEVFASKIRELAQSGNWELISNVLSTWVVPVSYKEICMQVYARLSKLPEYSNSAYNHDVDLLNNSVDVVLSKAIADKNTDHMKQCLMWYKPIAVQKDMKQNATNEYTYDITYELKNTAFDAAKAKVKQIGIKL